MRCFIYIFLSLVISFDAFCSETFILKMKSGTVEFSEWRSAGRVGTIESLQKVLENHDSKPLVRDALITMLKAKSKSELVLNNEHPLERIAVIEFAVDIPLQKILSSIRALPFVEYAEKTVEHTFIEIPNDFNTFFDQLCTYKFFQLTEAKRNTNLLIITASSINKRTCKLPMDILKNCFISCLCFFCQFVLAAALLNKRLHTLSDGF